MQEDGNDSVAGAETPRALLARRLAQAIGKISRPDESFRREETVLRDCFDEGRLITTIPSGLPDFTGSEHEVWSDGVTVTKATLPGTYGRLWGGRRFATPSEYLERIRLGQVAFSFPWQLIGLAMEVGRIRLVTRQPFYLGNRPGHVEIDEFMTSLGFSFNRHRHGDHWFRPEDSLLVFDAEPGNFVKIPGGLAPIDLILQTVAGPQN